METVFKVGDRVYEGVMFQDWGTVTETEKNTFFPIIVQFDIGIAESFTSDGRYKSDTMQVLSFTEYDLVKEGFSQERPETLPNEGDIVWVRDSKDEAWRINHFVRKSKDIAFPYKCSNYSNLTEVYDYKFMTTKNPYKNESN